MEASVVIYTSPTCGYCGMAKEYFTKKKIGFAEKDVTVDQAAYDFITTKTGRAAVPVITVNDEVIVGFNREAIDQALENAKKAPAKTSAKVTPPATDEEDDVNLPMAA